MESCEMRIPGYDARSHRGWIRWELFLHHEVRDVLLTPRHDSLRVVYRGDPDPDGWTATLTAAGFPTPRFEGTTGDANTDEPDSAASVAPVHDDTIVRAMLHRLRRATIAAPDAAA
jgi:hypothetical protein